MKCCCPGFVDRLAIAFLVFFVIGAIRGAMQGSAVLPSVAFSILCLLCAVGLYKEIPRVRTITAYFFLFSAVGAALVASRVDMPVLVATIMSGALATTGVGLLAVNRSRVGCRESSRKRRL